MSMNPGHLITILIIMDYPSLVNTFCSAVIYPKVVNLGLTFQISDKGPPKGGLESRIHAGFSDKSRPEIARNSCSRQVYPITLDARLIFHAIRQLFSSNSRFHALKYVESRHHAFPLGGPFKVQSSYKNSKHKIFHCVNHTPCKNSKTWILQDARHMQYKKQNKKFSKV